MDDIDCKWPKKINVDVISTVSYYITHDDINLTSRLKKQAGETNMDTVQSFLILTKWNRACILILPRADVQRLQT